MKKNTCFILFFLLTVLWSCKPQVPDKYIQPDEFEDILYDYHLANAMAKDTEGKEKSSYNEVLYHQAVLKKHGISQAEFDSSMVYYMRHADRLHGIYENLSKRFSEEALALGASANDLSRYGDMSSVRDTSNMWKDAQSCVLLPSAPYNVMSFDIEADSTYHAGDKIIFSFNSDFIYESGRRDGVALLAVEFKNDSVASKIIHVSSSSSNSITVSDDKNNGIKAIRGFIYLSSNNADDDSKGLRMMFVDRIRLVRQRSNNANVSSQNGAKTPAGNDTLQRQDAGGKGMQPEVKKADADAAKLPERRVQAGASALIEKTR